ADGEPWHVRLCVLPQPYGEVLSSGKFAVDLEGDEPWLTCDGQRWPLNPLTWRQLEVREAGAADEHAWREAMAPDEAARARYAAAVEQARAWWRETRTDERRKQELAAAVAGLTQDPDRLHALITAQYYRPVWWRREGELVNYRRFFNIGS